MRRCDELGELRATLGRGEHGFVDVEHVDDRLRGHEAERAQQVEVDPLCARERRAGVERGLRGGRRLEDRLVGLPAAHLLLEARDRLLERLEVGEGELGRDHLEVVPRVHDGPRHE